MKYLFAINLFLITMAVTFFLWGLFGYLSTLRTTDFASHFQSKSLMEISLLVIWILIPLIASYFFLMPTFAKIGVVVFELFIVIALIAVALRFNPMLLMIFALPCLYIGMNAVILLGTIMKGQPTSG